ncbi:hypothetical protein DH2020_026400 [Rehmannia glutinosa]|uniref:AB hydrolase-1 domain-containing protein n=1 Tax=Rehmannia glutinosa TaxID=99300 RepID=A0ABR0W0Z5_REHGL
MAAGTTRKISAASARAHTRRPKPKNSSKFSAWAYQATKPPPPKTCGSTDGPPVTAPRIQLKDGRHLAYKEYGVPKDIAKHKIVFVHGFDSCRHDVSALTANLSPDIVESKGIYIVSFDRPGYGESDPHPTRTVESLALDIEELADKLGLGSKFHVVGFSMGGQVVWSCLKYIPHRSSSGSTGGELLVAFLLQTCRNMHMNSSLQETNGLFVLLTICHGLPTGGTPKDYSLLQDQAISRQQGEFESLHRDMVVGFGTWEFDPTDLKNTFPEGSVHLWQGDDDLLVPVTLQRYIADKLPWIKYHELSGAGHMFLYADGMADSVIQALIA